MIDGEWPCAEEQSDLDEILKEEPRGPFKSKPSSPTSQKVQRVGSRLGMGPWDRQHFMVGGEVTKSRAEQLLSLGPR